MSRLRFGVKTSQARDYGDYETLRRVWLEADRLGFHSGWLFDHLFELPGDGPSLKPCLEAWTCLSALAAETKNLRLGVTVLCNNYRNPAILAKMASTLDVISGGRLEFGIGSGWASVEHAAYGIPFEKAAVRVRKLREAIRIIRLMWSVEKATYHGKYFSVEEAVNNPKPVQQPHPPIWVGGGGEALTLKAIAELADGCNFISLSPEEYAHKLDVLRSHCKRYARDPDEIQRSLQARILVAENADELREKQRRFNVDPNHNVVGTPEECIKSIEEYSKLGVTLFMFVFPEATRSSAGMELFMNRIAPSFI
jgi:F420-dependent oxidoreductase-like protein